MNKSTEIRTGRHCTFNLHVHLVFVTKYRRKMFEVIHFKSMHAIFVKICNDFDAELIEFNGESDHVHLLIHYPPKISLSKLVNSLKGVSSRKLRTQHSELKEMYYKGVLWSPSYFAASCGGAPITIIKQYIEQQKSPS